MSHDKIVGVMVSHAPWPDQLKSTSYAPVTHVSPVRASAHNELPQRILTVYYYTYMCDCEDLKAAICVVRA